MVDVDPTRFVQILSNVLQNAVKFTPPHGNIRCSVAILPTAELSRVAITIADTGVGISKDLLPRVFEMFTQAESATERHHGGLGIVSPWPNDSSKCMAAKSRLRAMDPGRAAPSRSRCLSVESAGRKHRLD